LVVIDTNCQELGPSRENNESRNESRRGNGDSAETRIRDAGMILRIPSTEVRFPRAIVRYRLPMSVVFSRLRPAVSSMRYFLFIARLIARSASLLRSLLLSFFLSRREWAGSNCLHCTDPPDDISHYIKLGAEPEESKDSGTGELSSAGS